uniref:Uncharacterized protein n=1 Tax=Anguilla anguilla TaxID=7936 RepID=A0A0E9W3U1_ANGAN
MLQKPFNSMSMGQATCEQGAVTALAHQIEIQHGRVNL